MLLATVPAAPPTRKNQRTTSCPAPISANVPYQRGSRLILSAFEWVSIGSSFTECDQQLYLNPWRMKRDKGFARPSGFAAATRCPRQQRTSAVTDRRYSK